MALTFGNMHVDRPFFMAPMEGITDVPFRKIVRKHGCGVICTQMIHASGYLRGNPESMRETTEMDPAEAPVGFQLCGSEPNVVAEAAKKAEDSGAAFIDLNMGCPAKNVVKLGAGAALLKDPPLAAAIVRAVCAAVSIPVTTKIRAGWDATYRNAVEVGQALEAEGSALVTVHARTRSQGHKGVADWDLIRELKSTLRIPVIGNGGLYRREHLTQMMEETGADGVMVARGALGHPWIFSDLKPTIADLRDTILEHLDLHCAFHRPERRALITFRKHLAWYTKGLANSNEFRAQVFTQLTREEMYAAIQSFFEHFDLTQPAPQPDAV